MSVPTGMSHSNLPSRRPIPESRMVFVPNIEVLTRDSDDDMQCSALGAFEELVKPGVDDILKKAKVPHATGMAVLAVSCRLARRRRLARLERIALGQAIVAAWYDETADGAADC
ncbi:uncharacterized protein PHACADRAFT_260252 [Phanerochaete carnosa HHB-10118-sp]|uniref:Uncharacterized protein n=1 Tax=Phanerochaete carnosa (strain HHB-10118-sp) TaxID=650164 RepID=K5UUS3_PHACS|nr:uncharacterized protein PHACADRAFT_260252 [Phanerochaete carnosa HHB-10118-sp]EKM53761.1 hypothetical protein PHACADRAFT_260252 [Phanerochaete carnosa HHB-10118-sp]